MPCNTIEKRKNQAFLIQQCSKKCAFKVGFNKVNTLYDGDYKYAQHF